MRGGFVYLSRRQLIILWCAIFAFLAVTAVAALAADSNLQIQPAATPRPACFTQWADGASYVDFGIGGSPDACYALMASSAPGPYGTKKYVRVDRADGGSCDLRYELRGPMLCPFINDLIDLKVSSDRVQEQGKFTLTWSSENYEGESPDMQCTLSGKAPEKGAFSEDTRNGSRTYDFVQRGIYTFKFSCEGIANNAQSLTKGTATRNITVYVGNIPPAPAVTIKAVPDTIGAGDSATLSWTSSNAIAVSISPGIGVVAKTGSMKVSPKFTTRYIITAAGEFPELGLAGYSATIRVAAASTTLQAAPPVEIPQEQTTTAAPAVQPQVGLLVNGQKGPLTMGVPANITLSWAANQYCIAYGSWLGIKTKADQQSLTLTKSGTYTYNLYCPGLGSDSVKVILGAAGGAGAVTLPVAEASISLDNKNFTKSIRVIRGEAAHVWLSAGYDVTGDRRASRDSEGGWSATMSNGGACDWNYDLNQGTPTFDVRIANPASVKDCAVDLGSVTFYDQPGVYSYGVLRLAQVDGKVSNISSITVAVDPPPPPDTAPVIDLRVNGKKDAVILGAPADYAVTWSVHNADSCAASDDWNGNKFLSGSQNFVASSKRDLTYTLTCSGQLGTTTQSILVKVAELPVCDFSALPTTLNMQSVFERQSVLSWKCQFANTCAITPSTGASAGTFGSARVSPPVTTTYTLQCENLDGNSSFDQTVEVR